MSAAAHACTGYVPARACASDECARLCDGLCLRKNYELMVIRDLLLPKLYYSNFRVLGKLVYKYYYIYFSSIRIRIEREIMSL